MKGMFKDYKTMGIVEKVISRELSSDALNDLCYEDRCKLHQYYPELFNSPRSKENAILRGYGYKCTENVGILPVDFNSVK